MGVPPTIDAIGIPGIAATCLHSTLHIEPWTEFMSEYKSLGLNDEIARYLESTRLELSLEKQAMKILDLGCKDGQAVAELCREGYDAYGVDVNADAIQNGRAIFAVTGLDPDRLVIWEDPSKISPLPEAFFHFVYSYHVFEHVRDPCPTVAELSRVTCPGGFGLHVFPGPLRPVEGHLFMPLVHWLPKNKIRKMAIRACVSLGIEPHWPQLNGASVQARTETYFRYSCDKTFYRTFRTWQHEFHRNGLIAREVGTAHPKITGRPAIRLLTGNNKTLLGALINTFKTIECLTVKVSGSDASVSFDPMPRTPKSGHPQRVEIATKLTSRLVPKR